MNNMMLRNLIIIATLFSSANLFAKEQQIGYYDSVAVMNDSTIWFAAKRTVETFQAQSESKLSEMEKTFKAGEEKYTNSKNSLTENERTETERKLNEQKQILDSKRQALAMDLEILQERLYGPILSNVRRAIQTLIAKYKLSAFVTTEKLSELDKPNALNLTQELIAEVIRLEKLRIVAD
jgi:Skp family chaperone for outer membrane proteins